MKRSYLVGFLLSAIGMLAAVAAGFSRTIERGLDLLFDTLAAPSGSWLGQPDCYAAAAPLAYAGPRDVDLRHEAGVARRAAPRNI